MELYKKSLDRYSYSVHCTVYMSSSTEDKATYLITLENASTVSCAATDCLDCVYPPPPPPPILLL